MWIVFVKDFHPLIYSSRPLNPKWNGSETPSEKLQKCVIWKVDKPLMSLDPL